MVFIYTHQLPLYTFYFYTPTSRILPKHQNSTYECPRRLSVFFFFTSNSKTLFLASLLFRYKPKIRKFFATRSRSFKRCLPNRISQPNCQCVTECVCFIKRVLCLFHWTSFSLRMAKPSRDALSCCRRCEQSPNCIYNGLRKPESPQRCCRLSPSCPVAHIRGVWMLQPSTKRQESNDAKRRAKLEKRAKASQ